MERTHIDDTELSILRDRLAEADNIASTAGGGYTQVPLITSLPHYSDDFPHAGEVFLLVRFGQDSPRQTMVPTHTRPALAEYKMEGFLQRSVTILKWKLLSFTPDIG